MRDATGRDSAVQSNDAAVSNDAACAAVPGAPGAGAGAAGDCDGRGDGGAPALPMEPPLAALTSKPCTGVGLQQEKHQQQQQQQQHAAARVSTGTSCRGDDDGGIKGNATGGGSGGMEAMVLSSAVQCTVGPPLVEQQGGSRLREAEWRARCQADCGNAAEQMCGSPSRARPAHQADNIPSNGRPLDGGGESGRRQEAAVMDGTEEDSEQERKGGASRHTGAKLMALNTLPPLQEAVAPTDWATPPRFLEIRQSECGWGLRACATSVETPSRADASLRASALVSLCCSADNAPVAPPCPARAVRQWT